MKHLLLIAIASTGAPCAQAANHYPVAPLAVAGIAATTACGLIGNAYAKQPLYELNNGESMFQQSDYQFPEDELSPLKELKKQRMFSIYWEEQKQFAALCEERGRTRLESIKKERDRHDQNMYADLSVGSYMNENEEVCTLEPETCPGKTESLKNYALRMRMKLETFNESNRQLTPEEKEMKKMLKVNFWDMSWHTLRALIAASVELGTVSFDRDLKASHLTPLLHAEMHGDRELITFLVEKGAAPDGVFERLLNVGVKTYDKSLVAFSLENPDTEIKDAVIHLMADSDPRSLEFLQFIDTKSYHRPRHVPVRYTWQLNALRALVKSVDAHAHELAIEKAKWLLGNVHGGLPRHFHNRAGCSLWSKQCNSPTQEALANLLYQHEDLCTIL